MSNLVEKILLTGFGIFILLLFLSNFIPVYDQISSSRTEEIDRMQSYIDFSSEINYGIKYFENSSGLNYIKKVNPPSGLNMTITSNIIVFEIKFNYFIHRDILYFKNEFNPKRYINLHSNQYLLKITNMTNLINLNLSMIII
ncbi:MAG: hypothetical protein P8Y70_09775 [Candidatus Lokiarchaeota archaeon]